MRLIAYNNSHIVIEPPCVAYIKSKQAGLYIYIIHHPLLCLNSFVFEWNAFKWHKDYFALYNFSNYYSWSFDNYLKFEVRRKIRVGIESKRSVKSEYGNIIIAVN